MNQSSPVIGYILLGLVSIALGFLPVFIAMYKKNSNASQLYKATPIVVLGLGAVGLALSLLFQNIGVAREVWALIILIVVEVIRLAAWLYLVIMAVKDKDLPIF
ncbi:MAG: hypothetical protein IJJ41_02310 [Clostridia bacterium]|nr:hypothetical protein [Clostridia bacterium]